MKRGFLISFFLLLIILVCFFAAAESLSLRVNESREIKGVNFTLLRTNVDEEKVILCVNNRKVIISDRSNIDLATIRMSDVFNIAANFEVDVACSGKCKCDDSCSNNACFASFEMSCKFDSDCDDNNPNTVDACVSGICKSNPIPLLSCSSDSECDDSNSCTIDSCNNVIDKCVHTEINNCSLPPEQLPEQEEPKQPSEQIPFSQLLAYVMSGIVVLLLIALVVKKLVR